MKSQVHVEYLIMVSIGVLLALIAASGLFTMANAMKTEILKALDVKSVILEGLK